jgi:hypothetical protein
LKQQKEDVSMAKKGDVSSSMAQGKVAVSRVKKVAAAKKPVTKAVKAPAKAKPAKKGSVKTATKAAAKAKPAVKKAAREKK